MGEEIKNSFESSLEEVARAVLMESMITGVCTMKVNYDFEKKEIDFEIISPFKGCECDDPHKEK